jgi:hypothetical protein
MAAKKRPSTASAAASGKAARVMPAFTKAPPAVIAAFDGALAHLTAVERRSMFGYPAAFANGQMFGCVFQDRIMVRLGPEVAAARDHFQLEVEGVDHHDCPGIGRPANADLEAGVPAPLRDRDGVIHDERDAIIRGARPGCHEVFSDEELQLAGTIARCHATHLPAAQCVAVKCARRRERRSAVELSSMTSHGVTSSDSLSDTTTRWGSAARIACPSMPASAMAASPMRR